MTGIERRPVLQIRKQPDQKPENREKREPAPGGGESLEERRRRQREEFRDITEPTIRERFYGL